MTIDALPTPPSRSDPSNFASRADAFLTALPTFVTQANALAVTVADDAATSTAAVAAASGHADDAEAAAAAAEEARLIATGAANYRGDYSAGTAYTLGQSVSYSGSRYIAKQSTTGNLPTNTTYWLELPSSGTVTSVGLSAGTTGLSVSGSPITSSGSITLSGTVAVAHGGTGQTTYTNGQLLIGNTSGNTLAKGTLTAGTGIGITNGAGSITVATSAQLQSVHNLATTGLIVRSASDTVVTRSVSAGAGISVTNGDGVSGNLTIAADAASDADFQAATANKIITAGILNTANAPEASSGSSTWTPDFDSARCFTRTLTGSQQIANPSNARAGQSGMIFITQTGTSAYSISSWGSYYKWPAGAAPTLDTGQNKVNVIGYYVKSATEIVCSYVGAY